MSRSESLALSVIDETAAGWVGRCDAGLTATESSEFAVWRDADPRHAAALARFEGIWSAADRPRQLGAAEFVQQRLARRARDRRRRRAMIGGSLAACLALGVGLWSQQRNVAGEPAVAAHTAYLGPERQTLPDGSIAEFSPGTRLTVDFSGNLRRIAFAHGEAHFNVRHDPTKPFVVTAGGLAVRAVGTAFAVQVGTDATSVLVTAGRVAVEAESAVAKPTAPLALIDAGQSIDVRPPESGRAPVVVPLPASTMTERLAWRQPRVEFSAAPLAEVVAVVNRHNRVQFSIADSSLEQVPLSGVFRLDDPEGFARLLEAGFALVIERPDSSRRVLRVRR